MGAPLAAVDLFDTTQLALNKAMEGSSLRQRAISQNLANVDTPGYKRVDVSFEDQLQSALQSKDPSSAVDKVDFSQNTDNSSPIQADGNSVDLSTETADEAQNGLSYEALTQVASARITILQYAMGVK